MARAGQARLSLNIEEAQALELFLRLWVWTPTPRGLLSPVSDIVTESDLSERKRFESLKKKIAKVVGRRRQTRQPIVLLIDRIDAKWIADQLHPRKTFLGRTITPSPLSILVPAGLKQKLKIAAQGKRGRKSLSRTELELGGYGSDQRHKKRLLARLRHERLVEEWVRRRIERGQSIGLLATFDPDDPYPNLPKLKPLVRDGAM